MSWVRLNMKYASVCTVCRKRVRAGQPGLWLRGVGVKHPECAEAPGVECVVCGNAADCGRCPLAEDCDTDNVALCMCSGCESKSTMESYAAAAAGKFPRLKG